MDVFEARQDYRSFTGGCNETIKLVSEGKISYINGDGEQNWPQYYSWIYWYQWRFDRKKSGIVWAGRKSFGYRPTVGVEEGIERAIKWYREEMKGIENNEW